MPESPGITGYKLPPWGIIVRGAAHVRFYHCIRSELVGSKSYLLSTGSARRVQRGYSDSDYRLELGHWPTHGFGACEIPLVHNVVLSCDVL